MQGRVSDGISLLHIRLKGCHPIKNTGFRSRHIVAAGSAKHQLHPWPAAEAHEPAGQYATWELGGRNPGVVGEPQHKSSRRAGGACGGVQRQRRRRQPWPQEDHPQGTRQGLQERVHEGQRWPGECPVQLPRGEATDLGQMGRRNPGAQSRLPPVARHLRHR